MRNHPKPEPNRVSSKLFVCLIAWLALLSPGFTVNAAPAGIPQAVTIAQHSELGGSSVFVISGAINDAGAVTLDSVLATALPAPVVGTAHYVRTYHGSLGTFTLQLQTLITPTDVPWLWTETGHWVIIEATGAYEGLAGVGQELGVRNFLANTLDAVFTGEVH
jgi:ABC-type transporter Mla maintaining outer membrane lipid asymmetry permease subunit MlaE